MNFRNIIPLTITLMLSPTLAFSETLKEGSKQSLSGVGHDCVLRKGSTCTAENTCKDMIKYIAETPDGDRLYRFTYSIDSVKGKEVYRGKSSSSEHFGKDIVTYECDVNYTVDKIIPIGYALKKDSCDVVQGKYIYYKGDKYILEMKDNSINDTTRDVMKVIEINGKQFIEVDPRTLNR